MPKGGGRHEQFAWRITRQQLGEQLRERYRASKDLPTRLLRLVQRLDKKPEAQVGSIQHNDVGGRHVKIGGQRTGEPLLKIGSAQRLRDRQV
jgi:hypothetical protein